MTKSTQTKPGSSSAASSTIVPLSLNPAIARCQQAWERTFNLALDDPNEDPFFDENHDNYYFARVQAARAFLGPLPPLGRHENIRDFIACVCSRNRKNTAPGS